MGSLVLKPSYDRYMSYYTRLAWPARKERVYPPRSHTAVHLDRLLISGIPT